MTPMGRTGEPGEVANAVLFLASDAAKYASGINLVIDGGYTSWRRSPRLLVCDEAVKDGLCSFYRGFDFCFSMHHTEKACLELTRREIDTIL